jgi:hypothetical protein
MFTIYKSGYKQFIKMPLISPAHFRFTVPKQLSHSSLLDFKMNFFNKIKTPFFTFFNFKKADLVKIIFRNKKNRLIKNENGF